MDCPVAIVRSSQQEETLDLLSPEAPSRSAFALHVVSGPDKGRVIALDCQSPSPAIIGQASSSTIRLNDRHISRKHVELMVTSTHVHLVDLGSTNGTRVNRVRVREAHLFGGETISVGSTALRVETDQNDETIEEQRAPTDYLSLVLAEKLPFSDARHRVIAEFERRYVQDLLARHNGNVTRAARASGLAHRYFQLVRARVR